MYRVDLDKTGEFPLLRGVEGADGDPVLEEITRFGEGFTLEGEGGLVYFECPVDGSRANGQELFPHVGGNTEGRPGGDEGHLLTDERSHELRKLCFRPHLYQKNVQMRRREAMTSPV
jgi:hypothetical protein